MRNPWFGSRNQASGDWKLARWTPSRLLKFSPTVNTACSKPRGLFPRFKGSASHASWPLLTDIPQVTSHSFEALSWAMRGMGSPPRLTENGRYAMQTRMMTRQILTKDLRSFMDKLDSLLHYLSLFFSYFCQHSRCTSHYSQSTSFPNPTMFKQLIQDPNLPVDKPTPSYWQSPPHKDLLGIQSPQLPAQRDVMIIGSGITACSVSRQLLQGGYKGTVTILEAREVCSGATGRNGGRINCVAIQDFDKYSRLVGVEMAKKIVRFEMAHLGELTAVAKDLGEDAFKRTEVRQVETIAAVFSDKKLAELKELLANFEAALPEMAGRWKVVEEEARTVCRSHDGKRRFTDNSYDRCTELKMPVAHSSEQLGLYGAIGSSRRCLLVCLLIMATSSPSRQKPRFSRLSEKHLGQRLTPTKSRPRGAKCVPNTLFIAQRAMCRILCPSCAAFWFPEEVR